MTEKPKVILEPRVPTKLNKPHITVIDNSRAYERPKTMSGEYGNILTVTNRTDHNIEVINEFNVRYLVPPDSNKASLREKSVYITYAEPKNVPINPNVLPQGHQIRITEEELKRYGGYVYVEEVNIVIAMSGAVARYKIKHPYSIPDFPTLMQGITENFHSRIKNMGFCFIINEPEPTNHDYYLFFLNRIIRLGKTSYPAEEPNMVLFYPVNNGPLQAASQIYGLSELTLVNFKEFAHDGEHGTSTFIISKNRDILEKELERRKNAAPDLISLTELDNQIKQLTEAQKDELIFKEKELVEKHQKEVEKIEETSKAIAAKLDEAIKKNEHMEAATNMSHEMSKVFSKYTSDIHNMNIAESKASTAATSASKEQTSFEHTAFKFGATAALTVLGIFAAKKLIT